MSLSATAQRNLGLAFSYAFTIMNTAVNLFLTPFMIRMLGPTEYGIYQMMVSFSAYMLIINFGAGTIITRYVALYLSQNDKEREENFIGLGLLITVVFAVTVIIVSIILRINIGAFYEKTLTYAQVEMASVLFSVLSASIVITLFCQVYEGIICGYQKFTFNIIWNLVKLILRLAAIVAMLSAGYRALAVAATDLFLTAATLTVEAVYCHMFLGVKPKLYVVDKKLLQTVLLFSAALFIQTVAGQLNNTAGSFIAGLVLGPETVTLYSVAMTVFTMFSVFSTSAIAIFLPRATQLVEKGASGEELTDFIIPPSRVQTIISGAILLGFMLFGKQFIRVWVGEFYTDAWLITVIIMVPAFFYYAGGMVVSILDAMQKRMFRSLTLLAITIINVLATFVLMREYGYLGGPVALAATTVVGQLIIMNIYYSKVIQINILKLFREIFSGTLFCLMLAFVLCLPLVVFNDHGMLSLAVNVLIYTVVLIALLTRFGLSENEKRIFANFFRIKVHI